MEPGTAVWFFRGHEGGDSSVNCSSSTWSRGVVISKMKLENGATDITISSERTSLTTTVVRIPADATESNMIMLRCNFTDIVATTDNLSNLPFLNEPEILHFLSSRYAADKLHTYFGPILISINPSPKGNHMYDDQMLLQFAIQRHGDSTFGHHTSSVHVWDIAHIVYTQIKRMIAREIHNALNLDSMSDITGRVCYRSTGSKSTHTMSSLHSYHDIIRTGSDMFRMDNTATSNNGSVYSMSRASAAAVLSPVQLNHSVLISGESGSGKSESFKLILKYLIHESQANDATHCTNVNNNNQAKINPKITKSFSFHNKIQTTIVDKILLANNVLEVFGNARTTRNVNSSRFGRYVEVSFNHRATLSGGVIRSHLLESARVTSQPSGERNFHIFYQLIAGATSDERRRLHLSSNAEFTYISQHHQHHNRSSHNKTTNSNDNRSSSATKNTQNNRDDFECLREHLSDLGFDDTVVDKLFQIIAGILHIGQITFDKVVDNRGESCKIHDFTTLRRVADLCGLEPQSIEHSLLVKSNVVVRGECISRVMTTAHSTKARDALAKALYNRVFNWIVSELNHKISPVTAVGGATIATVSILDIFGFESKQTSSNNGNTLSGFEDLCINYMNETLQSHFNRRMFDWERREFESQLGITNNNDSGGFTVYEYNNFQSINSTSQACLELLNEYIFHSLDEQSRIPNMTDKKFARQLYIKCIGKSCFTANSVDQARGVFTVSHYVSSVVYDTAGFIERNLDEASCAADELISTSTLSILSAHLRGSASHSIHLPPVTETRKYALTKPLTPVALQPQLIRDTVTMRFRSELADLMERISRTTPRYIRCIKPCHENMDEPSHVVWDSQRVLQQLKCCGLLEAARISRTQYPIRLSFEAFCARYSPIITCTVNQVQPQSYEDLNRRDKCLAIVTAAAEALSSEPSAVPGTTPQPQVGKDRVYMTEDQYYQLESMRAESLSPAARIVQNIWRAHNTRKLYLYKLLCVLKVQSVIRCITARINYIRMYCSAITIQQATRGWFHNRQRAIHNAFIRRHAAKIQSVVRMFISSHRYLRMQNGATRIQAVVRGRQTLLKYFMFNSAIVSLQRIIRHKMHMHSALDAWAESKRKIVLTLSTMRVQSVVRIQSVVRKFLCHQKFQRCRQLALTLQRLYRARHFVENYSTAFQVTKYRFVLLQALYRGYIQCINYRIIKCHAVSIQSIVRMYITRRQYRRALHSIAMIQRVAYNRHQWRLALKHFRVSVACAAVIQRAYRRYQAVLYVSYVRLVLSDYNATQNEFSAARKLRLQRRYSQKMADYKAAQLAHAQHASHVSKAAKYHSVLFSRKMAAFKEQDNLLCEELSKLMAFRLVEEESSDEEVEEEKETEPSTAAIGGEVTQDLAEQSRITVSQEHMEAFEHNGVFVGNLVPFKLDVCKSKIAGWLLVLAPPQLPPTSQYHHGQPTERLVRAVSDVVLAKIEYGYKLLAYKTWKPASLTKKLFGISCSGGKGSVAVVSDYIPVRDRNHSMFVPIVQLMADLERTVNLCKALLYDRFSRSSAEDIVMPCHAFDTVTLTLRNEADPECTNPLGPLESLMEMVYKLHFYYKTYIDFVVKEYGHESAYKQRFLSTESYYRALAKKVKLKTPMIKLEQFFLINTTDESKAQKEVEPEPIPASPQTPDDVEPKPKRYRKVPPELALTPVENGVITLHTPASLYLKTPVAPALDFALNSLYHLMCGADSQTDLHSVRLIRMRNSAAEASESIFYEVSYHREPTQLHSFTSTLAAPPSSIEQLSYNSLSSLILTHIIAGVTVTTPENLYTCTDRDTGASFFHHMTSHAASNNSSTNKNTNRSLFNFKARPPSTKGHKVGGEETPLNILYFLPQMDEPIDNSVKAHLLSSVTTVAEEIVSTWCKYAYMQNTHFDALARVGYTQQELAALQLPLLLPKGVAVALYRRLQVLYELLQTSVGGFETGSGGGSREVVITHHMVFTSFYPELAQWYYDKRNPKVHRVNDSAYLMYKRERFGVMSETSTRLNPVKPVPGSLSVYHHRRLGLSHIVHRQGKQRGRRSFISGAVEALRHRVGDSVTEDAECHSETDMIDDGAYSVDRDMEAEFGSRDDQAVNRSGDSGGFTRSQSFGFDQVYTGDQTVLDVVYTNGAAAVLKQSTRQMSTNSVLHIANSNKNSGAHHHRSHTVGRSDEEGEDELDEHKLVSLKSSISFRFDEIYGDSLEEGERATWTKHKHNVSRHEKNLQEFEKNSKQQSLVSRESKNDNDSSNSARPHIDADNEDIDSAESKGYEEIVSAPFDTHIIEIATAFLKKIDFSTLVTTSSSSSSAENHLCYKLLHNLSFLPVLWLHRINESQLKDMFGLDILYKRQSSGAIPATAAELHSGSQSDQLAVRIVNLIVTDERDFESLRPTVIVADMKAVLGIKVNYFFAEKLPVTNDDNNDVYGGYDPRIVEGGDEELYFMNKSMYLPRHKNNSDDSNINNSTSGLTRTKSGRIQAMLRSKLSRIPSMQDSELILTVLDDAPRLQPLSGENGDDSGATKTSSDDSIVSNEEEKQHARISPSDMQALLMRLKTACRAYINQPRTLDFTHNNRSSFTEINRDIKAIRRVVESIWSERSMNAVDISNFNIFAAVLSQYPPFVTIAVELVPYGVFDRIPTFLHTLLSHKAVDGYVGLIAALVTFRPQLLTVRDGTAENFRPLDLLKRVDDRLWCKYELITEFINRSVVLNNAYVISEESTESVSTVTEETATADYYSGFGASMYNLNNANSHINDTDRSKDTGKPAAVTKQKYQPIVTMYRDKEEELIIRAVSYNLPASMEEVASGYYTFMKCDEQFEHILFKCVAMLTGYNDSVFSVKFHLYTFHLVLDVLRHRASVREHSESSDEYGLNQQSVPPPVNVDYFIWDCPSIDSMTVADLLNCYEPPELSKSSMQLQGGQKNGNSLVVTAKKNEQANAVYAVREELKWTWNGEERLD